MTRLDDSIAGLRRRSRELRGAIAESRRLRRMVRPVFWGSFRRATPIGSDWGASRGQPVDRVFLNDFFARHEADIRGSVLEVGDPEFTAKYGTANQVDIFDIDPDNPLATITADLMQPQSLPTARYDCVVLPQTLHFCADLDTALTNVWQSLRPGGVALITVPSVGMARPKYAQYEAWRFLPAGLDAALRRACTGGVPSVESHGNLVAMVAYLMGLAAQDLTRAELAQNDPVYPMVVCARVQKPLAEVARD